MSREITLDTETTGLSPADGHRIIEIGCVELLNHVPTGRTYQIYINPERGVPDEAFRVHGISDAFLADKPMFADIVDEFLGFIGESTLIMHNAPFDLGFLNAELTRHDRPRISTDRTIDTVQLARQKFPGAPANLDALCKRFGIDLSARALHGALKDAELLAAVYLQLIGGREPGLVLVRARASTAATRHSVARTPRIVAPTVDEAAAHQLLVARLKDALWVNWSPAAGAVSGSAKPAD